MSGIATASSARHAYFDEQLATGDYPNLVALMGDGDARTAWERLGGVALDEGRFEHGLQRLLAGIALDLEGRGERTPPAPPG